MDSKPDMSHVIGYSNGTRHVLRAIEQLALIHEGESADEIWEKLRLRNVILVGSDLLMTMYYGLTPEQRGLVEQQDLPIFTFPSDYISRLWNAIETVDPNFAEDYRQYKAVHAAGSKP